jgi:hypothetical protein
MLRGRPSRRGYVLVVGEVQDLEEAGGLNATVRTDPEEHDAVLLVVVPQGLVVHRLLVAGALLDVLAELHLVVGGDGVDVGNGGEVDVAGHVRTHIGSAFQLG